MTKEKQSTARKIFDKTFKDGDGKFAVAQIPNLPLVIAGVLYLILKFVTTGTPHLIVATIYYIAFLYWCYLEIIKGDDYFRRVLGVVVAIMLLLNIAS